MTATAPSSITRRSLSIVIRVAWANMKPECADTRVSLFVNSGGARSQVESDPARAESGFAIGFPPGEAAMSSGFN
jgi:hypothetical protein